MARRGSPVFLSRRGISLDTVQDLIDDATIGAGTDAFVTIAAADTPSAQRVKADVVCTGTSGSRVDHTAINAAIAAIAAAGGEIILLPGTYYLGGKVAVAGTGVGSAAKQITVRFQGGAILNGDWSGIGASDPILSLESWNIDVHNPSVTGSGSKGDGIGIALGSAVSTVHNCTVYSPRVSNCHIGIEFGIVSSASSGDNTVYSGYVSNCDIGINSVGFVNVLVNPLVISCTDGIVVDETRNDSSLKVFGATVLSCTGTHIDVRGGHGSSFYDTFLENSLTSGDAANGVVRLGAGDTVRDCVFGGTTFFGPGADHPSTDVPPSLFNLANASGKSVYLDVENVQLSLNATNPKLPSTALIVGGANFAGLARFKRIRIAPNAIPSIWDPSTKLLSNAGSGRVVIEQCPAPYRSSTGATIGGDTPTPTNADYIVDFVAVGNRRWFWAKDKWGHLAIIKGDSPQTALTSSASAAATTLTVGDTSDFPASGTGYLETDAFTYSGLTSTTFTGVSGIASGDAIGAIVSQNDPVSGLKAVLETIVQDGVHVHFLGKTYLYPVYPQGGSVDTDHSAFQYKHGVTFSGEGMQSTIIANWGMNASEDTEPLSMDETCHRWTFRDFQLYAGGPSDQSSDALDWDHACESLAERILVRRSRAKGFVIDGKDTATANNEWTARAKRNTIRDCVARGRPESPDIQRLGSGSMAADTYYYAMSWVDSLYGETICSEPTEITVASSGRAKLQWFEGFPQYDAYHGVTSLKIYRRSTGQAWKLVTTITDSTTRTYTDSVADASISGNASPPTQDTTLIFLQGFDFLAGEGNAYVDCIADGVTQNGFRLSRTTGNPQGIGNRIQGCRVIRSIQEGILVESGYGAQIKDNLIRNVGRASGTKSAILIQPARATDIVDGCQVIGNQIYDDQTSANSIAGGNTTKNAVQTEDDIAASSVVNTLIALNVGKGLVTNGVNDDATSTVKASNIFDKADTP